jgi:hypothetical protein
VQEARRLAIRRIPPGHGGVAILLRRRLRRASEQHEIS